MPPAPALQEKVFPPAGVGGGEFCNPPPARLPCGCCTPSLFVLSPEGEIRPGTDTGTLPAQPPWDAAAKLGLKNKKSQIIIAKMALLGCTEAAVGHRAWPRPAPCVPSPGRTFWGGRRGEPRDTSAPPLQTKAASKWHRARSKVNKSPPSTKILLKPCLRDTSPVCLCGGQAGDTLQDLGDLGFVSSSRASQHGGDLDGVQQKQDAARIWGQTTRTWSV